MSDLVPMLARNRNIALEVLNPAGLMSIMRLNHLQAPFNDLRTRQAVAFTGLVRGSMPCPWGVRPAWHPGFPKEARQGTGAFRLPAAGTAPICRP